MPDGPYEALEGADACLVLTEWEDFAALDLTRVKKLLRYPIVVDGRNLFDPALMASAGLNYYSVGRPDVVGDRPATIKASLKESANNEQPIRNMKPRHKIETFCNWAHRFPGLGHAFRRSTYL